MTRSYHGHEPNTNWYFNIKGSYDNNDNYSNSYNIVDPGATY